MTDRDLFIAALERADPAERDAWLAYACAGDADRRRRVDVLLRAHDQASKFLAAPAAEQLQPNADDPTRTAHTAHIGHAAHAAHDAHSADETTPAVVIDLQSILTPADKAGLLGKLDHYEIQEVVGTGGMGVVLKAFDPKLHRLVAIKLMAPHLAAHGSARKRFEREARAVAAVKNEHVVAIHQVETEGRIPYLVMEFVGGVSLQDRLERRGPLDVKEILRIGMQTARGLAAAHAQGIIHRDIKPANILLENGVERVKITDFGLARAVDDANLTRSGDVTGTPNYMSPEQSAGALIDVRSDLFSLGSVLYALCTGHPPFRAETPLAVLRRVADDAPRPVREINPDIPDWLDAIVRKLLAKNPSDRFQTAGEVADLLGQHLAHLQQPDAVPLPSPVEVSSSTQPDVQSWIGLALAHLGLLGLVVLIMASRSFWEGYFRPGYVAPIYMLSISTILILLMAWARRRSEPGWDRHWYELAIAAVAGGTIGGLLASWGEDEHSGKLLRASTWHAIGLVLSCVLTVPPNLVKMVGYIAAIRRAELAARSMPVGPAFDGRTALAVGFGFFVLVVGLFAAMFIGSLTEPNEDRIRTLWRVLGGTASLAVLSFGPGVFVARRWWRERRPEDRRADNLAAIAAGAGLGMTIMSILLVIIRMPELREHVFGRPTAKATDVPVADAAWPNEYRAVDGAMVRTEGNFRYVSRIERDEIGGIKPTFVLVELPNKKWLYVMETKVWNGLMTEFCNSPNGVSAGAWQGEPSAEAATGMSYAEAAACAKWLGGRVPTPEEWNSAVGYPRRGNQKLVRSGTPGVRMSKPRAVNSPERDVAITRVTDFAGNGREWTSKVLVPATGTSDAIMVLRGRNFTLARELTADDLDYEVRVPQTQLAGTRSKYTGFRVVIDPK